MNYDIKTNSILKQSDIRDETIKSRVPEWTIYFEWVVSDWSLNRNWYKIDSNAWFFDWWAFVEDFLKTWSILYNHDSDKPIWRPLSFDKVWDEIKVSWFIYDDVYTNWAFWRGLIQWLSTWHITHKREWENIKTWKRLTEEEFRGLEYEEVFSDNWFIVVTEAEIVEFSPAPVRSNRKSTLINEFSEKLNKTPEEVKNLFLKHKNNMWKEQKKDEAEIEANKNAEKEAEINSIEILKNDLETEKNKVTELEKNLLDKNTEIETLKNSLSEKESELSKKDIEINSLRESAKEKVLANYPKWDNEKNKTEVKNIWDFKNKYINK